MNLIEKEQLRVEIQHIFDSGANEVRIFEMVKSFIESRPIITKSDELTMRDKFSAKAMQGILSNNEMWMDIRIDKRNFTRDKKNDSIEDYVAQECYKMADAMIKEREL